MEIPADAGDVLVKAYAHVVLCSGRELLENDECEERIRRVASWFQNGKPWLLLQGNVGTGKTTLLRAMNLYLLWLYGGTLYPKVMPVNMPVLLVSALDAAAGNVAQYELANVPVLLLDDFTSEQAYTNEYGVKKAYVLEALLERYDKRLPTIINSNNNLAFIKEKYGERLHDRFCELADRIVFDYESFRTKQ